MITTTKAQSEFQSSLDAMQTRYSASFIETSTPISSRRVITPKEDKLFQQFLENHPTHKLTQALKPVIWSVAHVQNITQRSILTPNELPLIKLAQKYQEKYGIQIAVVPLKDVNQFVLELSKVAKEPTYIGIIAGGNRHFSPVLVHFDGKSRFSLVNLDGTVSGNELQGILRNLNPSEIFSVLNPRQADGASCRTEAAVILRNALLHLKAFSGGFAEALATGKLNGSTIIHLPPEWDYTSQISNKLPDANNHIVLRNAYSNDVDKRTKKETVAEFRQRHRQTFEFQYTLSKEMAGSEKAVWEALETKPASALEKDVEALQLSDNSTKEASKKDPFSYEVTLSVNDPDLAEFFDLFEVTVSLTLPRDVNNYLYSKSVKILADNQ